MLFYGPWEFTKHQNDIGVLSTCYTSVALEQTKVVPQTDPSTLHWSRLRLFVLVPQIRPSATMG